MPAVYLVVLGVTVVGVGVFLLWLGLRAQKKPNPIGNEAMIGETGIVRKKAGFRGRIIVEVRGETWWSRLDGPGELNPGDEVRVTGIDPDEMILRIEPAGRG